MTATVDILIPTYNRPAALAVTLTSLCAQTFRDFRVVISDQTEDSNPVESGEVQAVLRVLQAHGHTVDVHKHLPRRGMAEQRQFLLDQVTAPYALFIDDDLILEPQVVEQMHKAIQEKGCGFVGSAVIGLSFINDIRPHEQAIAFWEGRVEPEFVKPDTPQWERWRLHNAANLYHLQQRLGLTLDKPRKYRVAWVGACVIYDTAKLRAIAGYSFWKELPAEHCGEDVLVQLRLMERYGGCGLIPSGVYHQELPTTITERRVAADKALHWAADKPLSRRQSAMRNILFVELLGGIGDVLIALPAIQSLARSHPQAKLTVLTFTPGGELLENDPLIDKVICIDRTEIKQRPFLAREAVEELLAHHTFELIVSDSNYDGIDGLIQESGTPRVVTKSRPSPYLVHLGTNVTVSPLHILTFRAIQNVLSV